MSRDEWATEHGAAGMHRAIRLHIDRLVLHGFSPADRFHIAAEVQSELARILSEAGAVQGLKNSMAVERIGAETFNHSSHARAEVTGRHIAQAVYRGLQGSTVGSRGLRPSGALKRAGKP